MNPETYGPPLCGNEGCGKAWESWHRRCNVVFCGACLKTHECGGTPWEAQDRRCLPADPQASEAPASALPVLPAPTRNGKVHANGRGRKGKPRPGEAPETP